MEEKTIKKRHYRSKDAEPVAPVGYIKEKVEEPVEEKTIKKKVMPARLNVRTSPSEGTNIMTVLDRGTVVDVYVERKVGKGWSYIKATPLNGVTVEGYVMTEFLG